MVSEVTDKSTCHTDAHGIGVLVLDCDYDEINKLGDVWTDSAFHCQHDSVEDEEATRADHAALGEHKDDKVDALLQHLVIDVRRACSPHERLD